MKQATEIYSREFDAIFFKLPGNVRTRLQGRPEFRLRIGDYRVIYLFNLQRNELFLSTFGHRRDVYRF